MARRWGGRAQLVAGVVAALAAVSGSGCHSDPCVAACNNANNLGCAGTCDCSACGGAPSDCHDFFACAASQKTCGDIFFNCDEPRDCSDYVSHNCK